MRHCRYCGHEISDDATFCRACGKQVGPANQEVSQCIETPKASEVVEAPKAPEAPSTKKGSSKGIVIGVVAAIVVVACILCFVWPGFLKGQPNPPATGSTTQSTSASPSPNTATSSSSKSSSSSGTSGSASSSGSQSSSKPVMEQGSDGFGWLNADNPSASKPSEAKAITDFASVQGDWNCVFVFEPVNASTTRTRDYSTLTIRGAEGNFAVCLDWIYYDDGYERIDQSSSEDTWLNGEWKAGTLTATGDCTISITSFFTVGNTQYAVGTMEAVTGARGSVALYRAVQ